MEHQSWQDILLPQGNEDQVWELFHENSKLGRYTEALSKEEIRAHMARLHESLSFDGYPRIALPCSPTPLNIHLDTAITRRTSERSLAPRLISLQNFTTLLHYAYGITRDNKGTELPRPFRATPSGGALYPLEIFFHSACIENEKAGLYHYNPTRNDIVLLREGDMNKTISKRLVQSDIGQNASLIVFITAVFERSVFKYGDRGYRFIFLEAGHVAQNINLVATALGLGSVNIGGFFDREIDEFLDLDGVTHSTIYMVAIGGTTNQRGPASS